MEVEIGRQKEEMYSTRVNTFVRNRYEPTAAIFLRVHQPFSVDELFPTDIEELPH